MIRLLFILFLIGCSTTPSSVKISSVEQVSIITSLPKYGDKGNDVKLLQEALNKKGYRLTADGIYGKRTQAAVNSYLEKNNTNLYDALPGLGLKLVVDSQEIIKKIVSSSTACTQYSWKDRGKTKLGYYQGVALTFAKALCQPKRSDVLIVQQANRNDAQKDAFSWYKSIFDSKKLSNEVAGPNTLRHAYTLLLGLGMRESSGKYCCGRDMSANFSSADSAEAGLFQASWGAKRVAPEVLTNMFNKYQASQDGCYLETFKDTFTCSSSDWKNWGAPTSDGYKWQKLTKECPAFATEYAAVLIRLTGGSKGEFGPLRKKAAEVVVACDDMLKAVQAQIDKDPDLCYGLE